MQNNMSNDDNYKRSYEMTDIILMELEGIASPEQFNKLHQWLKSGPEAVEFYTEMIMLYSSVTQAGNLNLSGIMEEESGAILSDSFWLELSKYEATAPKVLTREEEPEESTQKVETPPRNESKLSLSVILSVAALVFIVLFIYVVPPVPSNIEVATLSNSIQAKWADKSSMQNGMRLLNDGAPFLLRKGLVELHFDTSARAVIEGPAEFQILAEDRIGLQYGKVYATVPQEATGFSIYTHNAKIIDMGTEFGVEAYNKGDTYVHVIKGKTTLIAGEKSNNKASMEITKGIAKKISAVSSVISDIPCNTKLFARTFNSQENIVWRGQPLNLADVVGGGNGFYGGVPGSGWNPETGEHTQKIRLHEWPKSKGSYNIVPSHSFIDGVFVPDGGSGPVVINSASQKYDGFKDTTGTYRFEISNGPAVWKRNELSKIPAIDFYLQYLVLNGVSYGTIENPAIYMHSNVGITFDLSAIRKSFPLHSITTFTAICGRPEQVNSQTESASGGLLDVYVFLDEECRFKQESLSRSDKAVSISLPIQPENRFLTLVAVDSDQEPGYDWCLFGNPVLEFE